MRLTIIIVSYEVKYFLEQCLFSVTKALLQVGGSDDAEVIVVDNASTDGSVEYLQSLFPAFRFIANKENVGFARANNQALNQARGEVVLFLNPDTILGESILGNCISFLSQHERTGAIGIRMIDGAGQFLPESKRGFPTSWRSFCKLSGLSSIFPRSKTFAGYNLGHLREEQAHSIEVIAGAFMMIKKEVLNKVGGFDERFFMYAEDIDLSRRIRDAGYENYYLGNEIILHFKGESTMKNKKYVDVFYGAMRLYLEKHYADQSALSRKLLLLGINARAAFAKLLIKSPGPHKGGAPHTVSFTGDKFEIENFKKRLALAQVKVKQDSNAEVLIFCEGQALSFAQIIDSIVHDHKNKKAMIHAAGSGSAVGSSDRNASGELIIHE